MELRFLGQTYSSTENLVETIPTDIVAQFRGQSYIIRRPVCNLKYQIGLRKYRGITYSK